jgi:hypothetical protein
MKKVVAEALRQSAVEESENVCTTVEERALSGAARPFMINVGLQPLT